MSPSTFQAATVITESIMSNALTICRLAVCTYPEVPKSSAPNDDIEPARWFRLAADQGNAAAQCNLGVMYNDGNGVPQDFGEAAK
jgi:TPR repeat protein